MVRPNRFELRARTLLRLVLAFSPFFLPGCFLTANAQTITILHSFGGSHDGSQPQTGLVQGRDGNLYGTTGQGGTNNYGTIFRISLSGSYTNLHFFGGQPNDGSGPGQLLKGIDGNFYGVAGGGTYNAGTIFFLSPDGTYTNLFSFGPTNPGGAVTQGSDSNFYGVTYKTIFRVSPSGVYTTLYTFGSQPNDGSAVGRIVQGRNGDLYGATQFGGSNTNCSKGCGTIFRVSPTGVCTTLYSFAGPPSDGFYPFRPLVEGYDGNFYGTCDYSAGTNAGTIFRISPSGDYTNLYTLGTQPSDGSDLQDSLIQGSDGNFYATTATGGGQSWGTIFRISPSGTYTTLCVFTFLAQTEAPLIQASDGNFYGTTAVNGTLNKGTIYRVSIPLNPPANQISAVQVAGNDMVFGIPSVAGETYQLQFTPDLSSSIWSNVSGGSVTNSIGASLTLTNSGGAVGPQGFYRFAITP